MSRVLMLYLEPAPYVVGLVKEVQAVWDGDIDVLFIGENLSQEWRQRLEADTDVTLPRSFARAFGALAQRLSGGNYELLHLAGWGQPLLLCALFLAWAKRIPVLMETDTPLPHAIPVWRRLIKKLVYPAVFKLPQLFLPGGSRQADYLRHYGVPDERIRIAQMTVDVTHIQKFSEAFSAQQKIEARHRYGLPSDHLVFLYVGRLEPYKGISDLLQAFAGLRERMDSVSLLVVGDGSLRQVVEAAASREPSIRYVGRLSGDAVWEAYNIADIFVLYSRIEPWGLVVNEAMAVGLPVIVSDRVGCSDDLVRTGENGLVVAAESPDLLLAALQSMAADPQARRQMAVEAERQIAGWTLENEAKNVMAAWREVLTP